MFFPGYALMLYPVGAYRNIGMQGRSSIKNFMLQVVWDKRWLFFMLTFQPCINDSDV